MLTGSPAVRVFVARHPYDLRRGFDGLSGAVADLTHHSVYSGHWFVFFNRRMDRVKALWWDRNGFALFYKRLERGRFRMRWAPPDDLVELEPQDLVALLAGFDLTRARRLPRWDPPATPRTAPPPP